jgi:hypothetical protein
MEIRSRVKPPGKWPGCLAGPDESNSKLYDFNEPKGDKMRRVDSERSPWGCNDPGWSN